MVELKKRNVEIRMGAINTSSRPFYVVGKVEYDSGLLVMFDDYMSLYVDCPHSTRFEKNDYIKDAFRITYLSCKTLSTAEYAVGDEKLDETNLDSFHN